jgi:hypothetical protein
VAGLSDVVVVGDWPAYRNLTASAEVDGVRLHRCLPSRRDLERELRRLEPCWLLIGKHQHQQTLMVVRQLGVTGPIPGSQMDQVTLQQLVLAYLSSSSGGHSVE